ncbi:MAG: dUTP diphosphatase [Spirochaetales bacterium]|nr:dUTP diphosphatase [Spirochaetales bacterium]MDD6841611.1 dUTP diphosphatase [Spirochaetales bacterium]
MIVVRFRKTNPDVTLPEYETKGASGCDVRAFLPEGPLVIPSGEWRLVPTGLCPEIPLGYEIQVRPRSGLAYRNGITCLNTPGTVDSDYRGEIKVNLINHSKTDFVVENGMRIAQFVIAKVENASFEVSDDLSQSERGEGGFGSTGVK